MAYGMPVQSDPTNVMGRRIAAYIIDVLLGSAVFVAVMALTKTASYVGAPSQACATLRATQSDVAQCFQVGSHVYTWKAGAAGVAYGITILASFLNLVVLQGIGGASIGKLILGLRVVDLQGAPCGVGRAIVRWICLIVDSICGIVGLVIASVTHPHRRIGDMAAGTYVIGLADAGRPLVFGPPAYQYAYPQGGAPEWTPPGAAPPPAAGWGTAPPPAWGAPPPAAPYAAAPYAGQAPPPGQPPEWGAPPPPPPATWGAQPPTAEPAPPAWGAPQSPTPQPPAPVASEPRDRSGWGTPPSTWGSPEPTAATPPPPAPPAPTPMAPTPPPAEPPAATPAPPAAPDDGESWWSKAFDADDEPET